jgi:hypothetical protein
MEIKLDDILSYEYIDLDYVCDIEVESNHNYVLSANGGICVHNSGKTWSEFDLITWICDHNRNAELDIYILRDTLIHCRDFTLKDFIKLLRINGFYDSSCYTGSPKPYYRLFGNNIYFRGLDDETSTEGYPSDILFFNEVLETEKNKVDALKMRCRKLIMMDWNPKLTKHWVFDLEGQPNVVYFRSTYKDNKHLEQTIIDEIESYNPDIEANVINKTANIFRWKVYGLGLRTDQEGNVFNDSQLNKFNIKDINLQTATIIGYADIADQGDDYFSFVIGAIIDKKVYVIDIVYTQKPYEYWFTLFAEMLNKYPIQKVVFESNAMGLAYAKFSKSKLPIDQSRKIFAIPSTSNKHSRIVTQAEVSIIPHFYFLNLRSGMYNDWYDSILNYKYDHLENRKIPVDAPDSLAGLSLMCQNLIK